MSEFEIHKELFPFTCDNPDCSEEYDIEKFYNVALFWGYICLTSGDYNLIGLTCPECLHTTVNKYKLDGNFLTEEEFKKFGSFRDPHGDIHLLKGQVVVPFSKHIIKEAGIDLKISASQPGESELIYHVPKVIKINGFSFVLHPDYDPKSLNANLLPYPWTTTEREILGLCEFENSKKLRVVPRISHEQGLYSRTDVWSQYSSFESFFGNSSEWDDPDSKTREFINDSIDYSLRLYAPQGSYASKSKPTNISAAEYNSLNLEFHTLAWGKPESKVNFEEFFRDYKRVRNKLNFEMIFRTEFLDDHVRRIYYEPNWQEQLGLDPAFENFDAPPSDKYLGNEESPPPLHSKKQVLPPTDIKKSPPPVKKIVSSVLCPPQIKRTPKRASKSEIKEMENFEKEYPELKKIISVNSAMVKKKKDLVEKNRIAPKQNILLTGETGAGKELFAAAAHEASRKGKSFVPINCAAISENLLESELFGHKKGAFTGATQEKVGMFKVAREGTIFLDEIGDMPKHLQVKFLRVIANNEIQPVGGSKPEKIDVKMIFATNKNLQDEVDNGNFREDLFYRIRINEINIPPLRKRKEDISILTSHFIALVNESIENPLQKLPDIDDKVLEIFETYDWPGNVRELKSYVEEIFIQGLRTRSKTIGIKHIPAAILSRLNIHKEPLNIEKVDKEDVKIEKAYLALKAYKKNNGDKRRAGKELGVNRRTIRRQLEDLPPEGQAELAAFEASIGKKQTNLN